MDNKMLIDATHPEETRVVVVRGNRVEEFDFEAENKKQLKGNIYLAKVTRVEPSLQAAFVDYGGNRHGFLAFSEIHPDYYQIPVADRQALLEEEAAAHKEANSEEEEQPEPPKKRGRRRKPPTKAAQAAKVEGDEIVQSEIVEQEESISPDLEDNKDEEKGKEVAVEDVESSSAKSDAENVDEEDHNAVSSAEENDNAPVNTDTTEDVTTKARAKTKPEVASADVADDTEHKTSDETDDDADDVNEEDMVESVGSEDAMEEVPVRRSRQRAKQYKIQEVIKRRQIILVQVVKEERGNKGAALTTYLSLAGRYSVLMPNTDRGGGISRKITNQTDRKRLRAIASDLDVAEGMGVILRTAGASRTKAEIKRDFEYLMRLWENVRDFTLKSSAPALVYEEGSLLKRSIRDLYNKDIKQVLVAGEEGYREAKDFMRMLMPSHAKNVQPYKDPQPIFARYAVETQLDAMFSPQVTLKSGGYIVINQTEALVSIDVNSGRSTRENSIEDTALSTNLETAEEVARQLRLRDLAGLIVIDFIDMEENRNNRAVERRLKECLRNDRARIQVGRISHFGLLEMSRQRIRAGVLESTMEICAQCEGTGYVRAPASVALYVLRSIEDYLLKGSKYNIVVRTRTAVGLYVLNQKRAHLIELEDRFGLTITIEADETIVGEYCSISRGDKAEAPKTPPMVTPETVDIDAELARDAELDAAAEAEEQNMIEEDGQEEEKPQRKRRRRRRNRSDNNEEAADTEDSDSETTETAVEASKDDEDAQKKKRRRRGRRGGRRERERSDEVEAVAAGEVESTSDDTTTETVDDSKNAPSPEVVPALDNSIDATSVDPASADISPVEVVSAEENPAETASEDTPPPKKARAPRRRIKKETPPPEVEVVKEPEVVAAAVAEPAIQEAEPVAAEPEAKPEKPIKVGWWQRRTFF